MLQARTTAIILALALTLVVLPGSTLAHDTAPSVVETIDFTTTVTGADTFMLRLTSSQSFNLRDQSIISVVGTYPSWQQDAGFLAGIVRGKGQLTCPADNGFSPCFQLQGAASFKDHGDVTVHPVPGMPQQTLKLETDEDPGFPRWGAGFFWDGPTGFHKADPADPSVTYRYFISVPGATSLDIEVHLHSNQPLTWSWVAHDGGFFRTAEDFQPEIFADTALATVPLYGETFETVPETTPQEHTYVNMGPSWSGITQSSRDFHSVPCCTMQLPSVGVGSYGVAAPDGTLHEAFGASANVAYHNGDFGLATSPPPRSLIALSGEGTPGTYRFFVDEYAAIGTQDLYVTGFHGPLA